MLDRFDLEEQMLEFQHILVDIDHLFEEVVEGEPTTDEISNVLLGLSALYNIKFNKLWRTFEELIRTHQLLSEPREVLNAKEAEEETRRKAFVDAMMQPVEVPTSPAKKKKTAKSK
jgi:hypothetical protein